MDHVAVVSNHAWDNVLRYGRDLGGRWIGGPDNDPTSNAGDNFYFCQVEFDGGTRIEILEPIQNDGSEFLRRFLARNGPGPHHFTFKTPDFHDTLGALGAAGYQVIGVNESEPQWKEAFLHPKDSHGMVIQVACDLGAGWEDAPPLPPTRHSTPTRLETVVHLVADLAAATNMFCGPLGMQLVEQGREPGAGEYSLLESGPWKLRLIEPTEPVLAHWMGNRPGRLQLLAFLMDDPALVPDAKRVGVCGGGEAQDNMFLVEPEYNLGTRLLLTQT